MVYLKDKIRDYLKRFFLIDDTPHKVAAGAALGVFFGIAPGEGVATTLIFASILRFNRLAATAGVLAVNTWTTILVLPFAASVGAIVFGKNYSVLISQFHQANANYFQLFLSKVLFFNFTLPLLAGFFIVAGVVSSVFYFVLLFLLIRKKHLQKDAHLLRDRN